MISLQSFSSLFFDRYRSVYSLWYKYKKLIDPAFSYWSTWSGGEMCWRYKERAGLWPWVTNYIKHININVCQCLETTWVSWTSAIHYHSYSLRWSSIPTWWSIPMGIKKQNIGPEGLSFWGQGPEGSTKRRGAELLDHTGEGLSRG